MSLFAALLVAVIILILLRRKGLRVQYVSLFALAAAMEMNNVAGFFVKLGGREIAYSDVALLAASLAAVCYLVSQRKVQRKQFLVSLLLIGAVLVGIVHTVLWTPATKIIDFRSSWDRYLFGLAGKQEAAITLQTALMFERLLLFLLNSYIIFRFEREELYLAANFCKAFTKLHILFALGEVLTKYLLRSNVMTQLRNLLFGVGDNTYLGLQQRGEGVAIFGWTREASHLPEVMFFFVVLCVLTKDIRRQRIWILLAVAVMGLSMAFSALLYIGCLAILLLWVCAQKRSKKAILALWAGTVAFVGLCCVLVSNDYYASRVDGFFRDAALVLSGKQTGAVTSAKVRLLGIVETWRGFCERPLFGLGLGTAYCHSGIVSLLSNLGLVGTGLWMHYCLGCEKAGKQVFFLFAVVLMLPNILEGRLGMLYAAHVLLVIRLINKFGMKERQVAENEGLGYYHHV